MRYSVVYEPETLASPESSVRWRSGVPGQPVRLVFQALVLRWRLVGRRV